MSWGDVQGLVDSMLLHEAVGDVVSLVSVDDCHLEMSSSSWLTCNVKITIAVTKGHRAHPFPEFGRCEES